ncbi:MAG: restriction endonuclease subunit S [Clostridia bacterium]|nr:restriction endonuclease subunit S [Clostridia bacterium]
MREMKDSGISWVGEIPKEWTIMPLYCFYSERKNKNIFGAENNLLSLSYGKVIRKDINTSEGLLPSNYNGYNIVEAGDIIIRPTDLQNDKRSLRTGLSKERGIITSAYIALKPKNGINSRFYHYLLHTYDILKVFYNMGNGVRQGLNYDEFAKLMVYSPSDTEQQRIAEFLDRECGKIDGLKADIQAQIDTLEQYKRSVITEAVTHGLNPSAPMKDSKVWYGQIPSEWKELKGKYVFKQRNDRGNNVCLQLLSPTQKYGVIPQDKYEELTGMNAVKLNDSTNYALLKTIHKGDYCISLRSFQGGFEYSEYEGVVSPAYQVFYPIITIADGYYKYLFKEKGFIDVMNSYTMSLRDGKNIAFDDFGDTFIPVPPLDEQQEIADYLDNKCAEIEQIIADKKSQIETLDGYKKSLIYEYVTGKKEVV